MRSRSPAVPSVVCVRRERIMRSRSPAVPSVVCVRGETTSTDATAL